MDEFKAVLAGLNLGRTLPDSAEESAKRANQGDLQAALSLAQSALECTDLSLRQGLCQLLRGLTHPGAAQVALLCLLSEFSKRPEAMELVLAQVSSPTWVPQPAPSEVAVEEQDPADLSNAFAQSEGEERYARLKKLVRQGQLKLALQLPLEGDDYQQLWPSLQSQPELLAEYLLELPLHWLLPALNLPEVASRWPRLAELRPGDEQLAGWLSPARTLTLGSLPVTFERYPSDAAYYDGGETSLETGRWKVQLDELGCRVNETLEIRFDDARDSQDYTQLAEHDRFFEGLSGSRHQSNKACSLSLSADEARLALATLDGAVVLYDLIEQRRLARLFPPGPVSSQAQPVRLRFSAVGGWLAGVHQDHYFLWDGHQARALAAVPAGLRGLFFREGQLWTVCRDGSLYRLDPQTGELHCELQGGGYPLAFSPDQRWLATYRQGEVEVYQLQSERVQLLSRWKAPAPVRMHFGLEGQVLILRVSEAGKTALGEHVWRMGWRTPAQFTLSEQNRAIEVGGEFWQELFKS
ncbi:MAG: hypothetical protein U0931_12925 [Vulcanimicrobiota bacterium]